MDYLGSKNILINDEVWLFTLYMYWGEFWGGQAVEKALFSFAHPIPQPLSRLRERGSKTVSCGRLSFVANHEKY